MSRDPTPPLPAGSPSAGSGARVPARVVAAVGAGAAAGSVLRYQVTTGLSGPGDEGFPWATWWVNVTGAAVLAVVATVVVERWPPTRFVRPFAGIGLCGGYTTWSTFMTETALLVRDQRPALAALYVTASVAGGLAATYAGIGLARTRLPRTRAPRRHT